MIRFGRILAGGVFLVLGVAGLFLPFLQGILFLVIGFSLLSSESEHARRLLVRVKHWARREHARQGVDDHG